jgi:hypothetical protein
MATNDDNIHLLPLDDYNDSENSSNESEDDSTEVVSNVDEEENRTVNMTKYLAFTSSSDDESETNGDDNPCSTLDVIVNRCSTFDIDNNNNRSSPNDIGNPCSSPDVVVIYHNPTFDVSNNNRCRPDNINNHYSSLDVAVFSVFKNRYDDVVE